MTRNTTPASSRSEILVRPDVFLIDGRNLLYRAADANDKLSAEVDGREVPTGGTLGFLTTLVRLRRKYGGKFIIAWEGSENFRYKLFPSYKERPEPTDAVIEFRKGLQIQEDHLRGILSKLGVRQYEAVGGEADDVIGTLSTLMAKRRLTTFIYSQDSDLMQLVNEFVSVLKPGKGEELWGAENVFERWNVHPGELALFKALGGDSSDKIPGIPAVGEKTAALFIREYHELDEIVKSAKGWSEWAFSPRYRELVKKHEADVRLYLRLTTIDTSISTRAHPVDKNPMAARRNMKALSFRRLLEAGNWSDLKVLST